MQHILVVVVAALLAAGCGPPYRGAVKAAPPGPVDVVRSMWGDYGGRCPEAYQFCSGASQAICCPIDQRCAEDSGGAYCAPRDGQPGQQAYGQPGYGQPGPACLQDEITCSYLGRTTCCAGHQRCCAVSDGPACCDDVQR